jgi:hypothetical protein
MWLTGAERDAASDCGKAHGDHEFLEEVVVDGEAAQAGFGDRAVTAWEGRPSGLVPQLGKAPLCSKAVSWQLP